jgi:hypothetical protein
MRIEARKTLLGLDAKRGAIAVPALLFLTMVARPARADEPLKPGEPRVLSEPGEVTDVVDAFDGDDIFDLHLTIGYQYSFKSAHIRRETNISNAQNLGLSTGLFTASNMNVATYEENTSRLNTRVDVGLFHDIALYFRMPIILSNDRKLTDLNGSAGQQNVVLAGGPNDFDTATGSPTNLFALPFNSPTRSGIEYLAVGADFGFMNQLRDSTKPTWMAGFEVRFGIGDPMHACNANPAPNTVQCAHPSDINRNGAPDGVETRTQADEGVFGRGTRPAGVTRGTTGLELHSFISRRIKYIEPYAGFRTLFEFPQDKSDFGQTDLKGSLVNHPPLQGWVYAGLQVIPWEHREQFQRVTFDGRFGASYRSEGRDYSELFDALGSSNAASLRTPSYASFMKGPDPMNPSVVDPSSQRVYFTGITDVSAHMGMQLSASVTWQAGEYIKFTAGGAYTRMQSHIITADQPCNPDFSDNPDASGPCRIQQGQGTTTIGGTRVTGIPNPNYKPTIDAVGRRFKADDTGMWDAWVMGVVMF